MVYLERKRFTVEEFDRMGETGVLREDDRVELIEGEILRMAPINARHAGCVNALVRLLSHGVGEAAVVAAQNPVVVGQHSEPQPDVALLRPRADFYRSAHPTAADVLLLVEVSDATLDHDRTTKVPLYAGAGIPELWLVDLAHERILVYREPDDADYRLITTYRHGDSLAPLAFPDLALSVPAVLG